MTNQKHMMVFGYVRVSTDNQLENYSIEEQAERLKSYCKAKDWTLVKIYTDGGYSGGNTDRPALRQLLKDIMINDIDAVVVYKLDRLSRNQKDTLTLIEDGFLKNNVDFISVNENFDTSTPFGRAMIGILSVFAQLEKDQITERFTMGRIGRGKAGYFHGGGNVPFGYNYDNGELIVNDYQAIQVGEVYNDFLSGKSINAVMNTMKEKYGGTWSARKVRNILINSIYIGKIKFANAEYQGKHARIVSDELYQETQRLLFSENREISKNSYQKTPFRASFLLSSLLFCDRCGARYAGSHGYYKCYSRSKDNRKYITDRSCDNSHWKIEVLDERIIRAAGELLGNQQLLDEVVSNSARRETGIDSNAYNKRLTDLNKQIERLIDLFQIGSIPMENISQRVNELSLERNRLEKALNENAQKDNVELFLSNLNSFSNNFDVSPIEKQRLLVSSMIRAIHLDGDAISIDWRI